MPSNDLTHAGAEVAPMSAQAMEAVLLNGDLGVMSAPDRLRYYQRVCESLGLNPLTQPFAYIKLNGKTVLYAKRDCTDQLRKIHNISLKITAREVVEDCYIVTACAMNPLSREDESIGAVPIAGLKGEARSNAMMKAETKAKRRVTLSICGLAMMDETEVDTVSGVQHVDPDGKETAQSIAQGKIKGTIPLNPPPAPAEPDLVPALQESIRQAEERKHAPARDGAVPAESRSQPKAEAGAPTLVPPSGPTDKFDWLKSVQDVKRVLVGMGQEQTYREILRSFGAEKSNAIAASKRGQCYRKLQEAATGWQRHFDAHQFADWAAVDNYRGASPIWVNGIRHEFNEELQKYEVVAG
jgi:hypothetical protein